MNNKEKRILEWSFGNNKKNNVGVSVESCLIKACKKKNENIFQLRKLSYMSNMKNIVVFSFEKIVL